MQTWVRFDEGWRVVAAHVSVIDDPEGARVMSILDAAGREPRLAENGRKTLAEELRLQLADEIVRGVLGAGHRARRNRACRALQGVAHAGARGDPPACGKRALSRRVRIAARWWRVRTKNGWSACSRRWANWRRYARALPPSACCRPSATHSRRRTRELRTLIHVGDPQSHHEINEAFHGIIYAGAHNDYLAEMAIATRARVQPFRRAQFRNLGRLAKSYFEHDQVVAAILRGDRPAAAAAMHSHILTVREEYEAYIQSL